MTTRLPAPDLLGIYLNDHLAGAEAGANLAMRLTSGDWGPADADSLQRLAAEAAEERDYLTEVMSALDVPVRRYKVWGAWAAERIGRFKPNGRLLSRSPLSGIVELEGMRLAVEGMAAGWRTLRSLADTDGRLDAGRLDELIARSGRQIELLERLRARSAGDVFGSA